MHANDHDVPSEVRRFGWSLLVVHLQKLEWLVERYQDDLSATADVIGHLENLLENGPDDPAFIDWCREALAYTKAVQFEAPERPKKGGLRLIDGGSDGEAQ
jgi:hypothetical protein